jgi:excisionase family DNA binding protein
MKPFTFEDLPNILGTLMMRMEDIERMAREIRDNGIAGDADPGLLTILEASRLVNLSVATIYSKVCRNEIPVNKQGKKLYFIKSELLEWISPEG